MTQEKYNEVEFENTFRLLKIQKIKKLWSQEDDLQIL